MLIATVGDAQTALSQLLGDLAATQASILGASSGFFSSWLPGNSDLAATATSLVTQLTNTATTIGNEISGSAPDASLTPQEIAQLSELQKDVISDRKLIGQQISSVDWTFGGIFSDATTIIENEASQAVTGISGALGINWTLVVIAVAIVGFVYSGLWRKVA